jgi:excinuclease UvrABC ATPase subunit
LTKLKSICKGPDTCCTHKPLACKKCKGYGEYAIGDDIWGDVNIKCSECAGTGFKKMRKKR